MNKELDIAITVSGKVVDNWLPMKIGYDHTPGAVVCIAVAGVPKYVKAFGVSDIDTQSPLKISAQFRVASISKMFTAVSILLLQEAGKLRLDDTVVSFLPWFKGTQDKTNLAQVTLRQLLSHNSGLFRDGVAHQWLNDNFPEKLDTTISAKAIIFENATTFKYSNHGYAVLGAVIEKVSGMPYCEYVIEKVITPLGLKNTLPDLPKVIPVQLVHGYERWTPDMTERKREPHIPTNAYASATGFISDVKDLAVFLAALHPDTKKSVLSRESRKAMRQIHGIINDEEMYGLGLSLETTSGEQTYGHSGGFAGFITNAISHITDNVQVIVLTNTNSSTAPVVSDNIMRLIYTLKKMKDVTYLATEPYSGTYRNRWGDVTVVSLGKDLIEFSAGTPNPVKNWSLLKKLKQHTFKNTDESGFGSPGETLTFTQIKKGTAQILTSDGMELSRIR